MRNIRLEVDVSSVSTSSSGPATGVVVLMFGDFAYPVAGWNDFIVVILDAWASALLRIVRGTSEDERVYFMEGPYAIELTRLQSGAIQLRAGERSERQQVVGEVPALSLVANAIRIADDVLEVCRRKAHRTTDVDRLETATAALRMEVPRLTN